MNNDLHTCDGRFLIPTKKVAVYRQLQKELKTEMQFGVLSFNSFYSISKFRSNILLEVIMPVLQFLAAPFFMNQKFTGISNLLTTKIQTTWKR